MRHRLWNPETQGSDCAVLSSAGPETGALAQLSAQYAAPGAHTLPATDWSDWAIYGSGNGPPNAGFKTASPASTKRIPFPNIRF
ncbi:hypothetical protein CORC01_09040 [Colletotrichum orchidophilum]|uniref:Uncharacterized protein n=1 Tax=Colletotrichum orchidophilum TaxID=1209926 RepID=A0A1G4B2G1_9PEZI|nr:uncharacterized protein CORC01_09040 [Colletotrichum orchidophilum]OHE95608.1 hypothetical protein CORC01_09040 [Colletotrichum orchidophilum]